MHNKFTQKELELLAQALEEYRQGVLQHCEDSDMVDDLCRIIDTIELKLEI